MILHQLKALALREGLVNDPAFESRPVPWIIVLDEDGSYLELRDTYQDVPLPEGRKGKPKRQAAMFAIPRRLGRTSRAVSDFLVDKSEYVLGIEPDEKRSAVDLRARRNLFFHLLREASEDAKSASGRSVAAFLSNDADRERCASEVAERGYAANDLFTFRVDGDFLHNDEALRAWWAKRALGKTPDGTVQRQCLLCGNKSNVVDKHHSLQIAGCVTSGVSLVTFNSAAFEKYGLERNDNAPICRECMTAYVEGLRRLVNPRYIDPRTGVAFPVQNVRLTGDTTAIYWADMPDQLVGTLSELMYAPQKVRDLLRSPHRGQCSVGSAERFFCLVVSGAQGRAILRSMHTGSLDELEKNLNVFFNATSLEGDRGEPKPLGFLLKSLVLQGKLDGLPPRLAGEVFLGVLRGGKLPRLVLSAVVQRNRSEQKVSPERAALLQLYFRSHTMKEVPQVSLDTESKDAPYRLGRLLSTYEQLQRRTQGNVDRAIVHRYFGAASTRPGTVFPQLVRLSQNHVRELGAKADYLQDLITGIVDGIDSFPPMLTLEEQGQFALGYYHQRQALFRGGKDKEQRAEEPAFISQGEINA